MTNYKVKCSNFEIANDKPFTLIAGPCQLENEQHAIKISTELKKITSELGINLNSLFENFMKVIGCGIATDKQKTNYDSQSFFETNGKN